MKIVTKAAKQRKNRTQIRPYLDEFLVVCIGVEVTLINIERDQCSPEFSMESMLESIAPNTPAAIKPTSPKPMGATKSPSNSRNTASCATILPSPA